MATKLSSRRELKIDAQVIPPAGAANAYVRTSGCDRLLVLCRSTGSVIVDVFPDFAADVVKGTPDLTSGGVKSWPVSINSADYQDVVWQTITGTSPTLALDVRLMDAVRIWIRNPGVAANTVSLVTKVGPV